MTRKEKKILRAELRELESLDGLTKVQAARMAVLRRVFEKPPKNCRSPWIIIGSWSMDMHTGEVTEV